MSYNIYLVDPVTRKILLLDDWHHMKGGTYANGGTNECQLNVTYNYSSHYARVFPKLTEPRKLSPEWMWLQVRDFFGNKMADPSVFEFTGIRTIYGLTGAESLPLLNAAIAQLGNDVDKDYWKPTEGNAKRALLQLLALATMRPDGLWSGD